jgi:predicted dehydrogenase
MTGQPPPSPPPSAPVRFGVVGTGWRAEYFVRLGKLLPGVLDVAGVVARRPERAAEVAATWATTTFGSVGELLAEAGPAFVISSVPWDANPSVLAQLAGAGVAVLSETPPAPDLAGLTALWDQVGDSGLVQVAEQYPLMPLHAARLAAVRPAATRQGLIGTPTSVQISSTHQYHAMALIRSFLGVGAGGPASVSAQAFIAPLLDPLGRPGWSADPGPRPATTTLATVDFGAAGMGLYDFTDNQWHNRLRSRRLVVRGSHGEIVDDQVTRWAGPESILRSPLLRRQSGYDLDLEGYDSEFIVLDGETLWHNPFLGLRLSDEEIAVLTLLVATAAWCRGAGPPPYPLAQASQDHALALAVDESLATGRPVEVGAGPWTPAGFHGTIGG